MWTPDPSQIITAKQRAEQKAAETWDALRAERDRRLLASDYTQLPDVPGAKAAWATYRQALRDLPVNTTDPAEPIWPVAPA